MVLTGTDARAVRPYTRYTSREEIGKRQGGNGISLRRAEMKLRKNEMKLRKNEIEVRKSFSVSHWKSKSPHRRISDFFRRYC